MTWLRLTAVHSFYTQGEGGENQVQVWKNKWQQSEESGKRIKLHEDTKGAIIKVK